MWGQIVTPGLLAPRHLPRKVVTATSKLPVVAVLFVEGQSLIPDTRSAAVKDLMHTRRRQASRHRNRPDRFASSMSRPDRLVALG
jgi:hypothetical protein